MHLHFILLLLLLISFAEGAPLTSEEKEYLQRLGFLEPARIVAEDEIPESEETREHNAIKQFQEYSGLESAETLDDAGKKKMRALQCGNQPFLKQLIDGMPKWSKNEITFSFDADEIQFPIITRKLVRQAFSAYEAIVPLKFSEVSSGGDIVLAFGRRRHGDCADPFDGRSGTLAHALQPEVGTVHFDADEAWQMMGPDDVDYENPDFLSVAMHEIGHALGLDHSRTVGTLMHRMYSPPVDSRGTYVAPKVDSEAVKDLQLLYGKAAAPRGPVATGGCANMVYGAIALPDYRVMLFTDKGRKFLEVQGDTRRFIGTRKIDVSKVFTSGPEFVTAAYYDSTSSRILLFHADAVWAYHFDATRLKVSPVYGYPKRLPTSYEWKTGAAFAIDRRLNLINFNEGYYPASNRMESLGHINDVYPNMPEDVAGFAQFGAGNWIGFTENSAFQYNFLTQTSRRLGTASQFLNC